MISAPVSWPGLRCVAPLYGISLRSNKHKAQGTRHKAQGARCKVQGSIRELCRFTIDDLWLLACGLLIACTIGNSQKQNNKYAVKKNYRSAG